MFLLTSKRLTLFSKTFATLLILYLLLLILREFNYGSVVRALIIKNTWRGGCGNIDHEIHTTDNSDAVLFESNSSINEEKISKFKIEQQLNKHTKHNYLSKTNNFSRVEAVEKLKNEFVKVRLNVVYDSSFAEEFPQLDKLENYVRNVIFSTQLIFNHKEISKHMKIILVVVNLKKSTQSFDKRMSGREILHSFGKGPDVLNSSETDLNVIMTFRSLWFLEGRRRKSSFETNYDLSENRIIKRIGTNNEGFKVGEIEKKIGALGFAQLNTFCTDSGSKILIFDARSLCSGLSLAHEMGHSFGIDHDGSGKSKACKVGHIMYSDMQDGSLGWSDCSVKVLIENFIGRIGCIFDPIRVSKSVPFKPLFDFSPQSSNLILPGKQMSIDAQCAQALASETAASSLNTFKKNGYSEYDTCSSLVCTLGGFLEIDIGLAPAGSQCSLTGGYCSQGSCVEP